MGVTLTTANDALKISQPLMAKQVKPQTFLFDTLSKRTKPAVDKGRYVEISLQTGWNRGIGNRAEGGTLPTAGNSIFDTVQVPRCYAWAAVKLTEQIRNAGTADGTVGNFGDIMSNELKNTAEAFRMEVSRQMYNRDGSGVLGRVNAASPATTLVLDAEDWTPSSAADTSFGFKYFHINDKIDTYTARTSGTKNGDSIKVTGIVEATPAIVVDSVTSVADDDYIVREDNYGNEPVGIIGAIGIATNTYLSLDRTDTSLFWWKPYITDCGTSQSATAGLSDLIFQKHLDVLSERWGSKIDLIVGTTGTIRSLQNFLAAAGRYNPFDHPTPVSGWDGVAVRFGSKQVVVDTDYYAPKTVLFTIDTSTWSLYQLGSGPGWVDVGGKDSYFYWNQNPRDGSWLADYKWFYYPICNTPNKNGCIRYITES